MQHQLQSWTPRRVEIETDTDPDVPGTSPRHKTERDLDARFLQRFWSHRRASSTFGGPSLQSNEHTHAYTHLHLLLHSHTHSHTHTHKHTHTHTYTFYYTHTLTHPHIHANTLIHTPTPSITPTHSLTLTYTQTHSLSHTVSCTSQTQCQLVRQRHCYELSETNRTINKGNDECKRRVNSATHAVHNIINEQEIF